MFLNDRQIIQRCSFYEPQHNLISPFKGYTDKVEKPSKGLSCCGYDLSLGQEFKVFEGLEYFDPQDGYYIDPRKPPEKNEYVSYFLSKEEFITIQPKQFMLACTVETINMPDDLFGLILDKSSLARLGLSLFNTILEPGWSGIVTLEIHNNNHRPIRLYPGMGICQLIFGCVQPPMKNYAAKSAKYQGQTGVTIAK